MSYRIETLGVGGILDQAVQLLKNRFALLVGILAVLYVPYSLAINGAGMMLYPKPPQQFSSQQEFVAFQQQMMKGSLIIVPLTLLGGLLVIPLTNGALIHAVSKEYLGEPVTVGQAMQRALRAFLPLVWTQILMSIFVMLGLILFILPGILALFRYGLSSYVVVVEGHSGMAALNRSKQLMLADRTKNYNTMFLLGLMIGLIQMAAGSVASFIPQQHVALIVQVLVTSVLYAFSGAAFVVFYFSCRCKAENFDLTRLAQQMADEEGKPTLAGAEG